MYVETIPNRSSPPAILLRESVRQGDKVHKRTLANLSHWPEAKLQALRRVLRGEKLGGDPRKSLCITRTRPHGHVAAVLRMIRRLGLEPILAPKRCRERDLVLALIAARVLFPTSKLDTTKRWMDCTLAEELGVADADEDELYAALDWLLAQVERAFRCIKGVDLLVRPIWLRTEAHVKAHVLLCVLAYYVQWHLREAWAELLYADEELAQARKTRDPVLPPRPSASALAKKATHVTDDGLRVQSFGTLLKAMGMLARNTCRMKDDADGPTFARETDPDPPQRRAMKLIELYPVGGR